MFMSVASADLTEALHTAALFDFVFLCVRQNPILHVLHRASLKQRCSLWCSSRIHLQDFNLL